ncbi:INO80 complex subunit B-like isoform X2 [Watersipora subatra]
MAELGITGKRVRKKPKYLRDEEEEEEPVSKVKKQKNKRRTKKDLKKEKGEDSQKPGIKLKIKFGGKSSSNSHSSSLADFDASSKGSLADGSDELDIENETGAPMPLDKSANLDLYDDSDLEDYEGYDLETQQPTEPSMPPGAIEKLDSSDEEREWLDAVESGNIEEYEKQKQKNNPSVLTARQRRRLHGGEEQLLELPTTQYGKPATKEQLDVRKQKAVQRKQLAKEKSEKAKKQTVDRLLNKSEAAIAKNKGALKIAGSQLPHMRYRMTKELTTISLPPDTEFPITRQIARPAPKAIRCGVLG